MLLFIFTLSIFTTDMTMEQTMNKRDLIELLVDLLDEDEIKRLIEEKIASDRLRLEKLEHLSQQFGITTIPVDKIPDDGEYESASAGVLHILQEAGRPIGNKEIRVRFKELYGQEIKQATLGNILWKGKNKKRYKKTGGTRHAKWKICPSDAKAVGG
jgi:hypothetical protein